MIGYDSEVDPENVKEEDQEEEEEDKQLPIYLIDCKDYVWSVAFGEGQTPQHNPQSWKRMKTSSSIILATGLQTGRIKLWDCSTGLSPILVIYCCSWVDQCSWISWATLTHEFSSAGTGYKDLN